MKQFVGKCCKFAIEFSTCRIANRCCAHQNGENGDRLKFRRQEATIRKLSMSTRGLFPYLLVMMIVTATCQRTCIDSNNAGSALVFGGWRQPRQAEREALTGQFWGGGGAAGC